jgi:hypothetical protein
VGNQYIRVGEIPKKVDGGWVGLNEPAARALGIKTKHLPYSEVIEYAGQKPSTKRNTIHHELIEEHIMRYGKLPMWMSQKEKYRLAHRVALRFEATKVTPSQALRWYREHK